MVEIVIGQRCRDANRCAGRIVAGVEGRLDHGIPSSRFICCRCRRWHPSGRHQIAAAAMTSKCHVDRGAMASASRAHAANESPATPSHPVIVREEYSDVSGAVAVQTRGERDRVRGPAHTWSFGYP